MFPQKDFICDRYNYGPEKDVRAPDAVGWPE